MTNGPHLCNSVHRSFFPFFLGGDGSGEGRAGEPRKEVLTQSGTERIGREKDRQGRALSGSWVRAGPCLLCQI